MIGPIRYDQREGGKAIHDRPTGLRPRKALEKLLEDQARGKNRLAGQKGLLEPINLRIRGRDITTQGQRPNTGIHENAHPRERSAL